MRRRLTVGSLLLAVAATGVGLGLYETGRRAAAPPPPPPSVWITPRGARYHAAGCRFAARGAPVPIDRVPARYGPCAYCRPPAAPVTVPTPPAPPG